MAATTPAAPLQFIRAGSDDDLTEGFAIATRLADDPDPIVHKAVGIFLKPRRTHPVPLLNERSRLLRHACGR